jgi:hypothetical protein
MGSQKIKKKKTIRGKETERIIGVEAVVEVFKSSVWKPFRKAPLYILYDYGIDDVRSNLQFIKQYGKKPKIADSKGKEKEYSGYHVQGQCAGVSIDEAIAYIEENDLEDELREETIDLWEEIELKFETKRKPKKR